MPLTHNDLRKGERVRMPGLFGLGPRYGTMADNLKGVTRMVAVEESNGHFPDIGSVYVDEILAVERDGEWVAVTMSPAHAKKRNAIAAFGF